MTWLDNSIMHTRGVAGGKVKETYQLTEKRQAAFQYTIGPYSSPVLQIQPGDRVVVETVDTFGGAIRLVAAAVGSTTIVIPFLSAWLLFDPNSPCSDPKLVGDW